MDNKELTVNPTVVLSLEGLKEVLQDTAVLNQMKATAANPVKSNIDFLVADILLRTLQFEVPPLDRIQVTIKGGQRGSTKSKVLKLLEEVGNRVDMVQSILIRNELVYRENGFSRRIENGSTEFDRLINWIRDIETTYEGFRVQLGNTASVDAEQFYQFYLDRSYELVGRRAKISIANLAAVDVQNGVGVHLSKWLRALTDPNRQYTEFMIREVTQKFELQEDLAQSYQHYDRVRGGLSILLSRYFPDKPYDDTKLRVYIQAWVQVAAESYKAYLQTVRKDDLSVALGFVGGNTKEGTNTALKRMESRLSKLRKQRSEDPDEKPDKAKVQEPTHKKRKIKKGW